MITRRLLEVLKVPSALSLSTFLLSPRLKLTKAFVYLKTCNNTVHSSLMDIVPTEKSAFAIDLVEENGME